MNILCITKRAAFGRLFTFEAQFVLLSFETPGVVSSFPGVKD